MKALKYLRKKISSRVYLKMTEVKAKIIFRSKEKLPVYLFYVNKKFEYVVILKNLNLLFGKFLEGSSI